MTIHIEQLCFDAIIGLLDFEREHTQRVCIDLQAEYPYNSPEQFIDYADIVSLLTSKVKAERYELLEEALTDLASIITAKYPQISALTLKISKPDILENCTVALSQTWKY